MKSTEFLAESSTLSALGANEESIKSIHQKLRLQHDAEYEPIKNKTEAKKALSNFFAIVAVNDKTGEAWGIGHYNYPISGGQQVLIAGSDDSWGSVKSLTQGLASIKGRGWKFYKSTQRNVTQARSDRRSKGRSDNEYGEVFARNAAKWGNRVIKQDAAEAYKVVRNHAMDLMDQPPEAPSAFSPPSNKDAEYARRAMQYLKALSEEGISAFNFDWSGRGSRGAMKQFFGVSYDYMLGDMADEFQKNEKLAAHKYIKYLRKEISNIVERVLTGGYEHNGMTASDYKKAR